jgi:sirohydrochlorin cobaltochelatase
MEAVAQSIALGQPGIPVACAYLELSTPDLFAACASLLAQGVRSVTVVPMFLGVGRHAREDLPLLMTELKNRHPDVAFSLRPAVGEDPRLVDLLAKIAVEGAMP